MVREGGDTPSFAPLEDTWGMYLLAAFIVMLIFVPVYKASVDPTIYGAKKKKSKISGESVKKAMAAKKA